MAKTLLHFRYSLKFAECDAPTQPGRIDRWIRGIYRFLHTTNQLFAGESPLSTVP